jgi:hypothetical protein
MTEPSRKPVFFGPPPNYKDLAEEERLAWASGVVDAMIDAAGGEEAAFSKKGFLGHVEEQATQPDHVNRPQDDQTSDQARTGSDDALVPSESSGQSGS